MEFLAEINELPIHNVLNVLQVAELLGILGLHNRSSQQMKFEVAEKQQTVQKFVQQCWFFESEALTSKFADQADNIAPFTNPFPFPKDQPIRSKVF